MLRRRPRQDEVLRTSCGNRADAFRGRGHEHFEIGGARSSRWSSSPLAAGAASAQDIRARVQGLVSDPSGGVLPGRDRRPDERRHGSRRPPGRRTRDGRYLFDFVESGTYSVSAELTGFKTTVQKSVRVQQRGDITVDLKLEVGGIEETVTVTEAHAHHPVQHRDPRPHDRAGDGEGAALLHAQPAPARHARPHHDPAREHDRDPALPPPDRQRDGHRRRHQVPQRRPPRRHAAHRRQQARLHAAHGRGERVHDPAELGGRRVRPQRGRHRDRDHEVGHATTSRARPTTSAATPASTRSATGRPRSTTTTPTGTPGATIGLPIKKNKLFLFAVFDAIDEHAVPGEQLLAPDRARTPGRLLAVLQRRRHAARHLRPADLAHRQRRAGARPLPGEQDPREPLGPRGRADPGRPLGCPTTRATT